MKDLKTKVEWLCILSLTLYLFIFAQDLNKRSYGEDNVHTETPLFTHNKFLFTAAHLTDFHGLWLNHSSSELAVNVCVCLCVPVCVYRDMEEVTSFILCINDKMDPNIFCI